MSLLILFFSLVASASEPEINLEGQWRYYKKVYQGQEMLEPEDAKLRLFYSFYPDGRSRLFWYHEGEGDWCEREGSYKIERGFLWDKAIWVNPRNSASCSRDPDMWEGRETITPISLGENGDMRLHMFIGDDDLLMVWRRLGGR